MAIITGKVVSQTPVYFGPNTSTYPSNNSYAGPNDTVPRHGRCQSDLQHG